jgi:DNA polymerase III delta prime subunit
MRKTMTDVNNFLWVEKYRPKTIDDCVLPEILKNTFKQMIDSGQCQNLLLSGRPGCGKTTVAKAIASELDTDYLVVNCSEDGNIDTLRTKIRNFASTVSFSGNNKIVILDEFDYSNPQSMQPALRGFIEEFANNCRFILTCNYKNRIIEPLHSRCTTIDFKFSNEDKVEMSMRFMERLKHILDLEEIEYDEKVLAKLTVKYFPDFRKLLNEIQRYSVIERKVDSGILSISGEIIVKDLLGFMKSKDFNGVRKWVVTNISNDPVYIFRKIYDGLYDNFDPTSIPQAILILADYQYKSAFVADQEINLTACLIQLMMDCQVK